MSDRIGGYIRPGYDPIQVPSPPTLNSAGDTPGASMAFTAPSDVGGGAITSYIALATNTSTGATVSVTGASSPLAFSGLTVGVSYAFTVIAVNAFGPSAASNTITQTIIVEGQAAYTTAGSYTWVAPTGASAVSVVAVGGGGKGSTAGGAGGELRYKNNISVTSGNSYTVVVGAGGTANDGTYAGSSTFNSTTCVANGGQNRASGSSTQAGGSGGTGDGGGNGGSGSPAGSSYGSGGGAGGYSGAGGNGGNVDNHTAGAGGAGGGGASFIGNSYLVAYGGGGVGILGEGSSASKATGSNVNGGSGGANGGTNPPVGGAYGGGGGSANGSSLSGGTGGIGAVRIIWPGDTRSFPSTNTGDV